MNTQLFLSPEKIIALWRDCAYAVNDGNAVKFASRVLAEAAEAAPVQAQGVALSEREQFEAWVVADRQQQHPLEPLTDEEKRYLLQRLTKSNTKGSDFDGYYLLHVSNRWKAWQARAALAQAQQSEDARDKQRLDWLEGMVVNVRENLRYGSKDRFWATPADDDGDTLPSDIRKQIDRAIAALTGSGA